MTDNLCKYCSQPITDRPRNAKYCSVLCSTTFDREISQYQWRKKKEQSPSSLAERICDQCKAPFHTYKGQKQRFCCKPCAKAWERLQWSTRSNKH